MADAKSWLRVEEADAPADDVRLLRVSGELDLGTVGELHATVSAQLDAGTRVVLDLGRLAFCDSTGLGAIIRLHRAAVEAGGALVLGAPGQRVVDVLSISGVDQVIPVYPSVEAAVKALARRG